MKGYFWIFLKLIVAFFIVIFTVRYLRNPDGALELRKIHIANEVGYDNFLDHLLFILPDYLSNYTETLIYESDNLELYKSEFNGRIRVILQDNSQKKTSTVFPFFSENVKLHFNNLANDIESGIDQTELTFINIESLNNLLLDSNICNRRLIIEKFFEMRSLGGTPHEVLSTFNALDKTIHLKLASTYYNENSSLGDTLAIIRFISDIDNASRICQYGFFIESCSVKRIQFSCLEE